MKQLFVLSLPLFMALSVIGQSTLPVIHANSLEVDIRDGDEFHEGQWTIVPEVNPDVYTTSANKVTFYTDLDSIAFDIVPGKNYDFVVLVNGTDSAMTRIVWEPSKLDILKKAEAYDHRDERYIPRFTYQSKNHPSLVQLRKDLHLDSIAGTGS